MPEKENTCKTTLQQSALIHIHGKKEDNVSILTTLPLLSSTKHQ
jgi:hypothetical protein